MKQTDQTDDDQVHGDDEVEKLRTDENQHPCYQRQRRLDRKGKSEGQPMAMSHPQERRKVPADVWKQVHKFRTSRLNEGSGFFLGSPVQAQE